MGAERPPRPQRDRGRAAPAPAVLAARLSASRAGSQDLGRVPFSPAGEATRFGTESQAGVAAVFPRRRGAQAARARGCSPQTPRAPWHPRQAPSLLGTQNPPFLERPRLGLTTRTYNLHILISPVISPSELRCHKTRGAWQRVPHPTPKAPVLPEAALLQIIAWKAAKNN